MDRLLKKIILGVACLLIFTGWGMTIDSIADQRGTYQGFEYRYNEEYQGIEITGYTGNQSKVIIPATIDGVCVNSIGARAFYEKREIQEMVIPEEIDYFGDYCFGFCNIKSVVLPQNIKKMGDGVFIGCFVLEEVYLPQNIKSLPDATFDNCVKLKKIHNVSNIEEIGEEAFFLCIDLEEVDLLSMKKLKVIKSGAFKCCGLKSAKLPASLKEIQFEAFYDCDLEKISFQKGSKLKTIGLCAFDKCNKLQAITFPKQIKTIGGYAFSGCNKLKTIKFQNKVPKMGYNAFSKINSKATFYVPNKYKNQYTTVLKKNKWLKSKMKIKKL